MKKFFRFLFEIIVPGLIFFGGMAYSYSLLRYDEIFREGTPEASLVVVASLILFFLFARYVLNAKVERLNFLRILEKIIISILLVLPFLTLRSLLFETSFGFCGFIGNSPDAGHYDCSYYEFLKMQVSEKMYGGLHIVFFVLFILVIFLFNKFFLKGEQKKKKEKIAKKKETGAGS